MTTRTELIEWAQDITHYARSWKRLRSSKAYYTLVHDKRGIEYYVLKSYYTIVAVFSPRTGTVYEFDRYSTTTSQHCHKFAVDMGASRITYLYQRSDNCIEHNFHGADFTPNKAEWKNIIATDYALEIETINK